MEKTRVKIVTDSNSGITQKQAEELGITVLAMPFYIDEQLYFEDITLTRRNFTDIWRRMRLFLPLSLLLQMLWKHGKNC